MIQCPVLLPLIFRDPLCGQVPTALSRDTRKTLAGERARFLAVPTFLDNARTSVIKVMLPCRRKVTPTSTWLLRCSPLRSNASEDRLSLINCQVRFKSYLSRWKQFYEEIVLAVSARASRRCSDRKLKLSRQISFSPFCSDSKRNEK